jgi:hypothetical protein
VKTDCQEVKGMKIFAGQGLGKRKRVLINRKNFSKQEYLNEKKEQRKTAKKISKNTNVNHEISTS